MTMRGASAQAEDRVAEKLSTELGSVGSRKTAEVGNDLLGLAGVLRAEAGLRRMLTDASVDADAKQGFVRQVFADAVDPITLDVAATAASQRWTATRDLPDSLEDLGVETVVRSADDPGRVADELFAVNQLLTEYPELRNTLSDPQRSADDKRGLMESLFGSKTLVSTSRLIDQALRGTHRTVTVALAEYQKVAARVHGERVATVRAARELSDSEKDRLSSALARHYGRDVHLNLVVEPDLVGGVRVEIGDDVIDGTVVSRLDEARRRLAG